MIRSLAGRGEGGAKCVRRAVAGGLDLIQAGSPTRRFVSHDHLPPVANVTTWTPVVDDATILFLHATLGGTQSIDSARAAMAVAGLSTVRTAG